MKHEIVLSIDAQVVAFGQRLLDYLTAGGMSAEEVAEVKKRMDSLESNLKALRTPPK